MKTKIFFLTLILMMSLLVYSCSSDNDLGNEFASEEIVDSIEDEESDKKSLQAKVNSDVSVYFSRSNAKYWYGHFSDDFGNVSGYSNGEKSRTYINSNNLRVKLLKDKIGQDGGLIADVDISNGQDYIIKYKVKFQDNFQWKIGGKIPGIGGGKVYAGGQNTDDGKGWSFRPVWHQYDNVNSGNPYLSPYAYYVDQPSTYGNEFGKRYTIQDNTWYNIWIRVKMNTGSNSNGIIQMKVNNSTVYYDGTFRWVTHNDGREIDEIMFDVFRGGSGSEYEASSDNYIYFDNFVIDKQ